jgi:plasmid rolling circle replication initiator protein Rep
VITLDLSKLSIPKKHLEAVSKNLDYNRFIGSFYEKLIADVLYKTEVNRLERKLERLQSCNNIWELDLYKQSRVKDFIKTNLCKDKFCNNCKKVKQASRMAKFMPEINRVGQKHTLSQMVLTIPNVNDAGEGVELRKSIKTIFKAFTSLIEYLKLKKKIKGISFDIGYVGAIRSLEVTYKNNEYHPHLHVLIAHSFSVDEAKNINKYSYDKFGNRSVRYFSDFEILIQKLWYLLINDIKAFESGLENKKRRAKITKKRLEEIEIGYSCMMDQFAEDDFLELFKYMTKGDGTDHKDKEEGSSSIMTYGNFKTLYYALNGVRQIQGYGEFFRVEDNEELFEGVEETYENIINELKKKEEPEQIKETVQALANDTNYKIISKKQLFKYIKKIENNS